MTSFDSTHTGARDAVVDGRDALAARFPWPTPPGAVAPPRWLGGGAGFQVDGARAPVLAYRRDPSGWSDALTALHEAEAGSDHPIDLASRARAIADVSPFLPRKGGVLLEVGCSSGFFLRDARAAFPGSLVIGSDYVGAPLRALAASVPDLPLLQLDLTHCPLPDACVDAVVANSVLEHIEDDEAAVRHIFRILKPGGGAIIELPAGPHLYDVYDQVLMHHRRYTPAQAVALFARVGFRVGAPSHLGVLVYPAFALVKRLNKLHLTRSREEQEAIVAANIRNTRSSLAMKLAMKLERAAARYVRYPFGIRVIFTAIKP